jgi:CheY-like chemotaxis protein
VKKLLIAHELQHLILNTMNFLRRSEITVATGTTNDELLKNHITENANLIITKLDMPGLACETLIHTIRRAENMRKVSIILLCENTQEQLDRCGRCGVNAVFTTPVDPGLFARKVQEFLDVAPRRSYRVVLNVAIDGKYNNRPFMCSSQNISAKGMLIRTPEHLALGERIACSFYLPDGNRLSASGEIVRVVKENSGMDVNHYGLRFLSLSPDAETAITSFVDKELKRGLPSDTLRSTVLP